MTRRVVPAVPGIPALEPIRQDLYDTKQLIQTGVSVLEFFKNPNAGGELFTNMSASGQLPHPQQFHVLGIAAEIFPDDAADALLTELSEPLALAKKKVREGAWLKFHIGAKDYLTIPLKRVPEGVEPVGFAAGSSLGATANGMGFFNGIQDINHYYDVTIRMEGKIKPIHIPSQQSFFVQIFWPTPLDFSGTFDFAMEVRVYLIGILWREVQ